MLNAKATRTAKKKKNSKPFTELALKNDFACEHTFLYISLQLLLQDYNVKLSSYTFYEGDVQLYESHKHN